MQAWTLTIGDLLTFVAQLFGLIVVWWVLATNHKLAEERHKTLMEANEATWAEVLDLKKHLGLVNGGTPRYVTTERIKSLEEREADNKTRLDSHSTRLRTIEVQIAARGE